MSGHSKWNNIKNKKEKSDSQRAKIFTKIGREIAVAVKAGGPDPANNAKLKDVIAKAKSLNVPNDNIERSIKKAAGDGDASNYESITYEGYGPSGVAVIVETLTDNRNRTASSMRHYFDKFGGNLGQVGCVGFMFDKKGIIIIDNEEKEIDEETLMMQYLDGGTSDFAAEENYLEISTEPDDLTAGCDALEAEGYKFASAQVENVPQTTVALTSEDDIKNMNKLVDALEEDDDVQDIYHNWEENE